MEGDDRTAVVLLGATWLGVAPAIDHAITAYGAMEKSITRALRRRDGEGGFADNTQSL